MTVLTDIYRAPDDDPKVKESHRVRAGRMLIDRIMAMYPTAVRRAADGLVLSGDSLEHSQSVQDDDDEEPFDVEVWNEIIAELKQKEEQGIFTPDPNAPKIDYSYYHPPDDFDLTPYLDEEDAKFRAGIALRAERRKQWPKIEGAQTKETRPDIPLTLRRRRRTTGNIGIPLRREYTLCLIPYPLYLIPYTRPCCRPSGR